MGGAVGLWTRCVDADAGGNRGADCTYHPCRLPFLTILTTLTVLTVNCRCDLTSGVQHY